MMIYKVKNWPSSIMGPSGVVLYEVGNWVSSITGPSLMTRVRWMLGAMRSPPMLTPFELLFANPLVNVTQNLLSHVHVQGGALLTRQTNFPCLLQKATSQHCTGGSDQRPLQGLCFQPV